MNDSHQIWIDNNRDYIKSWNQKYYEEHSDIIKQQNRKYRIMRLETDPTFGKKEQERTRKYRINLRKKAIEIVGKGKVECSNGCGCDNIALLEINHLNNDGAKERKRCNGWSFYKSIVNGKRQTNDLNLRCEVCHSLLHTKNKIKPIYEIKFLGVERKEDNKHE